MNLCPPNCKTKLTYPNMSISQRDADLLIHESTGGKDVGEVLLRRRGHRYIYIYHSVMVYYCYSHVG